MAPAPREPRRHRKNITEAETLLKMIDDVHENPCRKGLVTRALDWKWSRAAWYVDPRPVPSSRIQSPGSGSPTPGWGHERRFPWKAGQRPSHPVVLVISPWGPKRRLPTKLGMQFGHTRERGESPRHRRVKKWSAQRTLLG